MNTKSLIFVTLLLFTFTSGCQSLGYATGDARKEYIQTHDLSPEVEHAVRDARVIEGMTHDQVVGALGKYSDYNRSKIGDSYRVQLVYEGIMTPDMTFVYLEDGVVTGWQNLCKMPRFCTGG